MGFGDFLYRLSDKDMHSLGIQLFRETVVNNATAASMYAVAQVPLDRVLVLQSVQLASAPLASGDVVSNTNVILGSYVDDTTIPENYIYLASSMKATELNLAGYGSATVYESFEFDNVLVAGGQGVAAQAGFSAATGPHRLTAYFYGFTIPRGNIAL